MTLTDNLILSDPTDTGYIDISRYKLDSLTFLDKSLIIHFIAGNNNDCFNVHLDNIVSFNHTIKSDRLFYMRVDSEGSSYGLDVSIRLKQPQYKDFMVLYLFGDEEHTQFVFRGLAERISVDTIGVAKSG